MLNIGWNSRQRQRLGGGEAAELVLGTIMKGPWNQKTARKIGVLSLHEADAGG